MKKIINPWKGLEGYNCFGCAPDNEVGVKMEFYEDGDEIVSIWKPRPEYQGWIDTLHGGIQAVLLDEICAWTVLRKLQTTGVTSKMETRYRRSIDTKDSHVVLRASIKEVKRNIVCATINLTRSGSVFPSTGIKLSRSLFSHPRLTTRTAPALGFRMIPLSSFCVRR